MVTEGYMDYILRYELNLRDQGGLVSKYTYIR